jgi:hypothetical protein
VLVDLTLEKTKDPELRTILDVIGFGEKRGIQHVGKGLYVMNHWSFEYELPGGTLVKKTYSKEENARELASMHAGTWFSEYGVCDSPTQFMASPTGKALEARPGQLLRKDQPADGGWRWHKWGPYIGEQKREGYEYLYDEKTIDEVYTYHLYEVAQ